MRQALGDDQNIIDRLISGADLAVHNAIGLPRRVAAVGMKDAPDNGGGSRAFDAQDGNGADPGGGEQGHAGGGAAVRPLRPRR